MQERHIEKMKEWLKQKENITASANVHSAEKLIKELVMEYDLTRLKAATDDYYYKRGGAEAIDTCDRILRDEKDFILDVLRLSCSHYEVTWCGENADDQKQFAAVQMYAKLGTERELTAVDFWHAVLSKRIDESSKEVLKSWSLLPVAGMIKQATKGALVDRNCVIGEPLW